MKTDPVQLNSTEFSKFIVGHKFCVVKAGLDEKLNFNSTLHSQLKQFYKITLGTAVIDIHSIEYSNTFIISLIGDQMERIGIDRSAAMLPGYYLFKDSRLVAYHPGTFDISKLDINVQNTSIWFGIVMGVISGIATKSFTSALLTFSATMEVPTGMNIFKFFKEILESKSELDTRRKQRFVFLNEIDKAYSLLKIEKSATDDEVKKAWKNMLKEFHPDKSTTDKEERTRLCVHINEAYEIIVNHRKVAKNKFSFSGA